MPDPRPRRDVVAAWQKHRAALERLRDTGTLGPVPVATITGLPIGAAQSLYAAIRKGARWLGVGDLQVGSEPAGAYQNPEDGTLAVDLDNLAERRRYVAAASAAVTAEENDLAQREADLAKRRDKFQARDHATILAGQAKDREIAKLKREVEQLARELAEAGTRAEVMEALARPVPKIKALSQTSRGKDEAAAVVLLSDLHLEATVEPAAVNGLNAYNEEIARLRMGRLLHGVQSLLEVHRSKADVRTVVLAVIGDVINGHIHQEYRQTNWGSPPEAVLFAQELLAHVIDTLLEDDQIERLVIPTCVGNHGRLTVKPEAGTAISNSLEWLLYAQLSGRYAEEPRVLFGLPAGIVNYVELYDFTLRFEHGDSIRSQGGIGGIQIPLHKLIARRDVDRRADVTCLGHFHTLIPHRRYVVNGSLIGVDPYSIKCGFEPELAAQAFFMVDKRFGAHSWAPVWCQRPQDAEEWGYQPVRAA